MVTTCSVLGAAYIVINSGRFKFSHKMSDFPRTVVYMNKNIITTDTGDDVTGAGVMLMHPYPRALPVAVLSRAPPLQA